ncbi:hypothetical protein YC2023_004508 [Brassica napus]
MGAVKDVEEKKAKFQVDYSRTCFHISHEKDACPQLSENKYKQRGLTEITKQTAKLGGEASAREEIGTGNPLD